MHCLQSDWRVWRFGACRAVYVPAYVRLHGDCVALDGNGLEVCALALNRVHSERNKGECMGCAGCRMVLRAAWFEGFGRVNEVAAGSRRFPFRREVETIETKASRSDGITEE